jgi:DNA helicase-2/ATP-dependent DNA helicase PcrA
MHGVDNYAQASRLLAEIPAELIEEIRPNVRVSRPVYRPQYSSSSVFNSEPAPAIRLGQHVRHGKFGEGIVLNYEGAGAHARVQVNFATVGSKWLVMSYAKLELM